MTQFTDVQMMKAELDLRFINRVLSGGMSAPKEDILEARRMATELRLMFRSALSQGFLEDENH